MATNKERIENLERGVGRLQDGMHQMELGIANRLHQLKETIHRLSEAVLSNKEGSSHNHHGRFGQSHNHKEEAEGGRAIISSKMTKLEFPRYSGDDPTEWFDQVVQFFDWQGTAENQKVTMASFHLEREANQWRQWLSQPYREEGCAVSWSSSMRSYGLGLAL